MQRAFAAAAAAAGQALARSQNAWFTGGSAAAPAATVAGHKRAREAPPARVLNDDQRRRQERADATTSVSRFRQVAPQSAEALARAQDRMPTNGRFGSARDDAFDDECVPIPIPDPEAAKERGQAMWRERIQARAAAVAESKTEEEQMEDEDETAASERMWADLVSDFERVAVESEHDQGLNTRASLSMDPTLRARTCGGDQRMDAIRRTLGSLGYTRSQYQRMFHEAFVQACLPM